MKKTLKYLFITLVALSIIYIAAWFLLLKSISTEINEQYALQNISARTVEGNKTVIKFTTASPAWMLAKIAVKINGFVETSDVGTVECLAPIIVGYDLLKQSLFASFSGEAIASYEYRGSNLKAKINIQDRAYLIKIPLSIRLLKVLGSKKDPFEIVNFIESGAIESQKITAIDMGDNELLCDEDFQYVKLSFDKSKYYIGIEDFLSNIPKRVDLYYSVRINPGSVKKPPLPNTLLFGAILPFASNIDWSLSAQTSQSSYQDILNDLTVDIIDLGSTGTGKKNSFRYSSKMVGGHLSTVDIIDLGSTGTGQKNSVRHSSQMIGGHPEIALTLSGIVCLEEGFIDKYISMIKYMTKYFMPNYDPNIHLMLENKINDIIQQINGLKSLKELERRTYNVNLDMNISGAMDKAKVMINNLELASGKTGIQMRNDTTVFGYGKWHHKGDILFSNYSKLVDLLSNDFYNIGKYQPISDDARKLYIETNKHFVKSVSDHPESVSNDLSFKYDINLANFANSKIGSTDIGKISQLYYLDLYRHVAAILKPGENFEAKIRELIPQFDVKEEILNSFIR